MRIRRGWTLIELLAVVGVIAVLAGILLPALSAARRRSQEAPCISNLHQIGHAYTMYLQDYDRPAESLDELVTSGLVRDRRLLICPLDPTGRWGSAITDKLGWSERRHPARYPTSYLFAYSALGPRFIPASGTYGIAACQLHGRARSPYPDPSLLSFEGEILRLQNDGAVVRRQVTWARNPGGNGVTGSYAALFFDAAGHKLTGGSGA